MIEPAKPKRQEEGMRQLFQSAAKATYKNNRELELGDGMAYVSSGYVALVANIGNQETTLQIFGTGEIIDAVAFDQRNMLNAASALKALGATSVLKMPRAEFWQALASKPDMYPKYLAHVQQQNNWLINQQAALGYKDVYRRLVARLLYMAERFGKTNQDELVIGLSLTHRQLATSVSSTRETVNKLMKQLETSKILLMKNRSIRIFSIEKLAGELTKPD